MTAHPWTGRIDRLTFWVIYFVKKREGRAFKVSILIQSPGLPLSGLFPFGMFVFGLFPSGLFPFGLFPFGLLPFSMLPFKLIPIILSPICSNVWRMKTVFTISPPTRQKGTTE